MVATNHKKPAIKYVTPEQGAKILDRQARTYLGMSGEEFKAAYRAGTIKDPDRSDVLRVSMLIPLSEQGLSSISYPDGAYLS